MAAMEQRSGTGALLANDQTYLGDVAYALTVTEAPPGDLAIAGEFAFVTAPRDLSDAAPLSLALADGTWLVIVLKQQDPLQNLYTFAGTGLYRARCVGTPHLNRRGSAAVQWQRQRTRWRRC